MWCYGLNLFAIKTDLGLVTAPVWFVRGAGCHRSNAVKNVWVMGFNAVQCAEGTDSVFLLGITVVV